MRTPVNPHTFFSKDALPKKQQIMVKRYEKPGVTPGGIILPEPFLKDASGMLWEVVWASRAAERVLGCSLREDDILRTRESFPAEDTGCEDERDGKVLFLMDAERVYSIFML